MKKLTPFHFKDCALVAIATGVRAQNLRELAEGVSRAHPGCIYYHFWGGLLRPHFDDPEYNNDFAVWASRGLHDEVLAERLAIIDPTDYEDIEQLRSAVQDVLEERLDESTWVPWAPANRLFHFVRSQIVVFNTRRTLSDPRKLAQVVPTLSVGSIFFHFIDARRRNPQRWDDFRCWIEDIPEYAGLAARLAKVDPYFVSLSELRRQLAEACRSWLHDLDLREVSHA